MKKTAALLAFVLILVQFATAFDVQAVSGSITSGVESRFTVQFEDTYFDGSSFDYNHKLAQASLGMAMSAFRPTYDKSGKTRPQEHVEQFLIDCGFTYIHSDDYDKNPSLYTVATEIGRKMMVDSNGEPYTLIAVAVCGGGYSNEWLSNFTVGTETEHEGFASAAHLVVDRIFGYIGRANIKGRIKIWISGFSRAAAVGNITAARLVDSGVFSQDDIFAYLFATPRTTKDPRPGAYNNIFSIVSFRVGYANYIIKECLVIAFGRVKVFSLDFTYFADYPVYSNVVTGRSVIFFSMTEQVPAPVEFL